jgi:hypothetical protein
VGSNNETFHSVIDFCIFRVQIALDIDIWSSRYLWHSQCFQRTVAYSLDKALFLRSCNHALHNIHMSRLGPRQLHSFITGPGLIPIEFLPNEQKQSNRASSLKLSSRAFRTTTHCVVRKYGQKESSCMLTIPNHTIRIRQSRRLKSSV